MSKPNKWFEPWVARAAPASMAWAKIPSPPEHYDGGEKRQWVADWETKRAREARDRPWHCLGSNMNPVSIGFSFAGKPVVIDDREIILEVTKHQAWPSGGPSHADVAKRVAACVNAMAGIENPEEFMSDYHKRNNES